MAIGETLSQQFQDDEKLYRRFPPSHCANGRPDVIGWGVFSIQVGLLPKAFKSEQGQEFDFYPFHDPIEECPGHTLIHSCHSGAISPQYDDPTRDARNELRTRIFQQHIIELWPEI
jgi:hypothetical protein